MSIADIELVRPGPAIPCAFDSSITCTSSRVCALFRGSEDLCPTFTEAKKET